MECINTAPSWMLPAFKWMAGFGALLIVYVAVMTEKDDGHKDDSSRVKTLRKFCFGSLAIVLCVTAYDDMSLRSVFLLVATALIQLLINAIALRMRPPDDGVAVHVSRIESRGLALSPIALLAALAAFFHWR